MVDIFVGYKFVAFFDVIPCHIDQIITSLDIPLQKSLRLVPHHSEIKRD